MRSFYRLVELSIAGRDGSSLPTRLSFGWLHATHGAKFKIPLPRSCVRRPVEYTCQVSSTSADLPLVISFYWSHDIASEHSAVGLLLWLARRFRTHWQMNCELTLVILLNLLWRLSSLPLTSVFSALEDFAVMRYINWWLTLTLISTSAQP